MKEFKVKFQYAKRIEHGSPSSSTGSSFITGDGVQIIPAESYSGAFTKFKEWAGGKYYKCEPTDIELLEY